MLNDCIKDQDSEQAIHDHTTSTVLQSIQVEVLKQESVVLELVQFVLGQMLLAVPADLVIQP
jgi:hypothetical protein